MSSRASQFGDDPVTASSAEADVDGGTGPAVRRAAGLAWSASPSGPPARSVIGDLRAVAMVIDDGWRAALRWKSGCAVRLGEGSHVVHRALIALHGYMADVESRSG